MKKLIFSVLLLLMTVIGAMAQDHIVADGTTTNSYVPVYGMWCDAYVRSQVIYPEEILAEAGLTNGSVIEGLEYYSSTASISWGNARFDVLIGTTENSAFSSSSYANNSGFSTVYSGALSVASNKMKIDFSAPYTYTGGNIIVEIHSTATGSYVGSSFNGITQTNAALYGYSSSSWGAASCSAQNFMPKTNFVTQVPCPKPKNLAVNGVTHNSATISWTQSNGATNWVLEYGTNSDFSSATSKNVDTNPYSLSELAGQTTYYVRVKADCGAGEESEWSDGISFSTTAVAEEVGDSWSDDFEGAACEWELINGTCTNAWAWGEAVNNGGSHALYISNDGGTSNVYTNTSQVMVYATKLLNFATGKYEFSYNWMANGESSYDYLRVALVPASVTLTAGTSTPSGFSSTALPSGWIALDGGSKLNLVTVWQTKELAVNVTAGNYYLVFAWRDDTSGGSNPPAAVDNVSITRVACEYDVTDLAVSNITTTGAKLTWTAGDASQWQVAYSSSSDFAGATEQIVNTASFNMTSLTRASTYYVKVRAYCGGTDFGAWSSVLEFNTACDAITSFPWSEDFELINASGSGVTLGVPCWVNEHISGTGTYFFEVYSGTNGTNSTNQLRLRDMSSGTMTKLMLPVMNFGGVAHQFILDVYRNTNSSSYSGEGIRIFASTNGEIEGATEMAFISRNYTTSDDDHGIPEESASGWYTYEINIPFTGTCYIILRGESKYGSSTYMDNFVVREVPNCLKPTALSKSNVTARTVDLSWTAGGSETAWQICLNDNEGNPIDVNTNSYTLTGLTPETAYNVKVRAKCSESDYSEWTSNVSFTTPVSCPAPTALTCTGVTANTATLAWTVGASEENWILQYGTDNTLTENTEVNVSTNPFELTGLTAETTYYARIKANCGTGDESAWTSIISFEPTTKIVIGDGTSGSSYLPSHSNYNYSLTQQIYTASEINGAYNFSSIDFYNAGSTKTRNFDVYLVNTDKASFSSNSDWITVTESDKVFSGSVAMTAGVWTTITFTSDFYYDGVSNLAVIVDDNTGSYSSGMSCRVFSVASQAIYVCSDYTDYNPLSPPSGTGTVYANKNQIRLLGTPAEPPSCTKPTAFAYSNVAARTAVLSWTAGDSETAWQICLNDNEGNLIEANSNPFTLTGLTPETNYQVKVRAKCSESDYSEWTNSISFTTTVACPAPTAFAYSDISTTSATVSWTAGASESLWNLKYKVSTADEWTEVNGLTSPTYTITELTPATSYNVQVQADCEEESVSTWLSGNFTTECDAVVAFPWTENFESYNSGNFSAICWSNEHIAGSSSNVFKVTTGTNGSNSTHQLQLPDMSDGNMVKLALPLMTLPNENYIFGIDVYRNNSYSSKTDEGVRVYASTNGEIDGATELAFIPRVYSATGTSVPAEGATGWYSYKFNIPFSGNCYIILRGESKYGAATYMDNFVVREISTAAEILTYSLPTEAAPATFTSGDNTGTIDITVTYSTNFDADLNPTYTISDYAEISAPEISGNGDSRTIVYTVTAEAGNTKEWTVNVTRVSVSHDAFITGFTFAGQKAGTTAEIVSNTESNTYTVNAVAEWNVDLTSIAPEITVSPAAEITPESGYARDFTSPVTYTVTAEDGTTSHIYNVTIINDPDACVNPLAVNANDVTATTATLSWAQAYTETSYIVKVSTEEMTNMSATADVFDGTVYATAMSLENLTENTQYFVYVQSNCDNAEDWTEYSFRTECGVFAVPFVETFENNSETVNCWTAISNNTENDVASGKMGIFDVSGNNVFRFSSYSSASDYNQYLITPEFALTEDAVLTFDYAKSNYSDETFRVMTSTTDANIASFTALGDDVAANSTNFTEYRIVVPAATKYIAINYFSNYQYYLYVDNFKLTNVYTITASADSNGSIDQNGNVEVEYGESQSFTITPNDCYHIASVLVDGVEAISNVDENGVYTFDNVNAAHTIAATFALNTYNITTSVVGNGTITESCVANCGENKSFVVAPANTCYRIANFTVDGVDAIIDLDENGVYAMQNITADHELVATFEQITYTITATAEGNGTITETSTVNCGENKEITIAPANCYSIASVLVDDVDVTATVVAANGVYTFENVMSNHTIAATFEQITYTITATADANGTITANDGNGNVANCGENKMFTIAANDCYHVVSVLVDGVESINSLVDGVYTFANVTANHTIAATFAINTYNITTTVEGNGTINGESTANCGDNKSFVVAPANACYRIASFTVDGVDAINDLDGNGVYALQNITADHTLAATFEQITYTITATAEGNGSITETSTVNCGANKEITITPANCYSIASVLVDDVDVTATVVAANGVYTFENVMSNHTIAATFEQITYTITATADANGSITANDGNGNVANCGENKMFTIAANDCYRIVSVMVDGVEAINSLVDGVYTFANVTANHTIAATFAINTYNITTTVEGNGTINGESTANCGDNKSYTIAPANTCYRIASFTVDGVDAINDLDGNGVFALQNITADHALAATFEQITYTITATAEGNGTITETSTVNCGDNKEITITPANCYRIASVLVDDVDVTATVVATNGVYTFENVIASHNIAATFAISTYNITATAGEGGSITANDGNGNVANCSENKAFTITANEGYRIASVIVDETENVTEAVIAAEGVYTFENVTADHTIAATFERVHTISAGTGADGSITPEGIISVLDGESQTFTITPVNECFRIGQVMVDGVDVTDEVIANNGVYTFENVTENHNIVANFDAITLTITATAGAGGTIAHNADYEAIPCASNESYTIVANDGYRIVSVIVDDEFDVTNEVIANNGVYTFTNVRANHTIAATFGLIPANTYTITATAGENGTITPNGEVVVYEGDDQNFTIVAAEGYRIASVLVDETEVVAQLVNGVYTFTNITANHTIAATFEAIPTYTLTIHYVYADNTPAAEDHVETLVEGAEYSVASPVVTGYTADQLVIEGTMPANDVVVNVTYTINTYTITATAGENGTITPNGELVVNYGATQAFTIVANDGYRIASIMVDETEDVTAQLVDGVYTFENVIANHTIAATFESIPTYTLTIHYVYADNTPAADDYVETLVEGAEYSVASPVVTGHTADQLVVEGTMPADDVVVNVTYTINTYTITATAGENGTITPSGDVVVNYGATQTFTISANDGYRIMSVLVDGAEAISELVDGVYTFANISANHTIAAAFVSEAATTYTITATADENGIITPSGVIEVVEGESRSFTIEAAAGYHIVSVMVDETENVTETVIAANGVYTFDNVTADHTIAASFAINTYTITATAGDNGTITPAEATVNYGASQEFTITANEGYRIASVMVDETEDVTTEVVDNVYTFTNVTANHTIAATFEAIPVPTYTITLTVGEHGSVTPSGENGIVTVNEGDDITFTVTPDEGYLIGGLIVDETPVYCDVEGDVVNFNDVHANHTIEVVFTEISATTYTITATAGANGTINPEGEVTVSAGENKEFTIVANEGYRIASVIVDADTDDEEDVTDALENGVYTFENVTANHTIHATFEDATVPNTHTVTLIVGDHGTVTASDEDDNEIAIVDGAITVNHGDDLYLEITPDENYKIETLAVNGVEYELDEEEELGLTLPMLEITEDMAVSVTFTSVIAAEMFEAGSMTVYPNPNNGMFSIDFSNIEGDATYQIINANGAVVETRDINVMNGETMNFNHDLRPGAYFVRIINGDKVYVEQIVVE